MLPTLRPGERIVVERFINSLSPYKRGDIVVVYAPTKDGLAVKRLIGLPSDQISVREGKVFLNGKAISEPYIRLGLRSGGAYRDWPSKTGTDPTSINIPEAHIFVLGDNRDESIDSRVWGLLPEQAIYGRKY
jgi:signal peptidase I